MWKHKVLHHPEEEVSFSMEIVKKQQSCFPRLVMESIAIEMGELNGHWILNSKTEYNSRCKIPRLAISHGNKVHTEDIPHEQEPTEDLSNDDIEQLFENNKRKSRKKERDHDHNTNSNAISSLPASKRRKKSKNICTDSDGPENAKHSNDGIGVSRIDD